GIPHLLKGGFSEGVSNGVDVYSIRQPVGVVAGITPFNFPAMVPMWFFPVAIAAGNTFILKPSEKDPSAAIWLAKLWKEAGLPEGVFTVLNGDKVAVDRILEHPKVKAISFVGSTPIAKYVYETGTKNGKRVQALGGAKNHMVVLPDADLELTADAAINAGFGSAGERCMAISVVVAVEPVADELIKRIVDRMGKLVTGDGTKNSDMGPLVTKQHRDKVASYVEESLVAFRGTAPTGAGFWFPPTVLHVTDRKHKSLTDEIFGPIVSVVTFEDEADGIALANDSEFGLSGSIWTNNGAKALRVSRGIESGNLSVNSHSSVRYLVDSKNQVWDVN
ncbi:MAG: hypothetical protein RLY68_947, partial [Actinomycetota bacterium]